MPFNYYDSSHGTLASRLDKAWDDYRQVTLSNEDRKAALLFMFFVFNITEPPTGVSLDAIGADISDQLIKLMEEREAQKDKNPEFIPNQGVEFTGLSVEARAVVTVARRLEDVMQFNPDAVLSDAMLEELDAAEDELLSNTELSLDLSRHTEYIASPEERAKYQIVVRDGMVYKDGVLFDSSDYISHSGSGYAAFTLNANGELSVFNHVFSGGQKNFYHSSMNSGSDVIAAGELKVTNGKIEFITNYSGHYKPSAFNLYRFSDFLKHKGVDLSSMHLQTMHPLDDKLSIESRVNCNGEECLRFHTPADTFATKIDAILDVSLAHIEKHINLKARLLDNGDLLRDRKSLATKFLGKYSAIKANTELPNYLRVSELLKCVNHFIDKNNELSLQYGKGKKTQGEQGRLAKKFSSLKKELLKIKAETVSEYEDTLKLKF